MPSDAVVLERVGKLGQAWKGSKRELAERRGRLHAAFLTRARNVELLEEGAAIAALGRARVDTLPDTCSFPTRWVQFNCVPDLGLGSHNCWGDLVSIHE